MHCSSPVASWFSKASIKNHCGLRLRAKKNNGTPRVSQSRCQRERPHDTCQVHSDDTVPMANAAGGWQGDRRLFRAASGGSRIRETLRVPPEVLLQFQEKSSYPLADVLAYVSWILDRSRAPLADGPGPPGPPGGDGPPPLIDDDDDGSPAVSGPDSASSAASKRDSASPAASGQESASQ